MARSKRKPVRRARAKKVPVRRSAVPATRAKRKAKPRHKFVAHRYSEAGYKTDGLRTYAKYRDLGIRDATGGMAIAHVIRFVPPCEPAVVSKNHFHDVDLQMIYVLKGWIETEIDGHGAHIMRAGDAWLQPPRIRHKVLNYSDDCEVLEIVLPADFETVELEA